MFVELSQEEAVWQGSREQRGACPASHTRRQVIIKLGTGAYAVNCSDNLDALKQLATLSAIEATGLSNISMFLTLNGKPVHDESSIFDGSGVFSGDHTFILQAALPGGGEHDAQKPKKLKNLKLQNRDNRGWTAKE